MHMDMGMLWALAHSPYAYSARPARSHGRARRHTPAPDPQWDPGRREPLSGVSQRSTHAATLQSARAHLPAQAPLVISESLVATVNSCTCELTGVVIGEPTRACRRPRMQTTLLCRAPASPRAWAVPDPHVYLQPHPFLVIEHVRVHPIIDRRCDQHCKLVLAHELS